FLQPLWIARELPPAKPVSTGRVLVLAHEESGTLTAELRRIYGQDRVREAGAQCHDLAAVLGDAGEISDVFFLGGVTAGRHGGEYESTAALLRFAKAWMGRRPRDLEAKTVVRVVTSGVFKACP